MRGFLGTISRYFVFIFPGFLCFLASCAQLAAQTDLVSPEAEAQFRELTAVRFVNREIELDVLDPPIDQQNSGIVRLAIQNRSEMNIEFAPNYGVQIFGLEEDGETWRQIPNNVQYHGDGETLEPRVGDTSNWVTVVTVEPDRDDLRNFKAIRIVVQGELVESGQASGSYAGAFVTIPAEALP